MFEFLKRRAPTPSPRPNVPPPAPASDLMIQAELVRAALTQTLRSHGVPALGLHSEVTRTPSPDGQIQLHIQLVITRWNDVLLQYAVALERELLLTLARYEPSFDHARDVVSWRFDRACQSPYTDMPPPDAWHPQAVAAPAPNQESIDFFDRRHKPRSPSSSAADREAPGDFEETRLAPP